MNSKVLQSFAAQDVEGRIALVEGLQGLASSKAADVLFTALGDPHWRVRKAAVEILIQSGAAAELLPGLVERLSDPENAGLRNAVLEVLVALGDRALPSVREALASPDPDVRLFACNILGQIRHPSSVQDLLKVVSDPDENVRTVAVENLGRFSTLEAQHALEGLLDSPDVSLKFLALEALALQGGHVPFASLERLAAHPILRKPVFEVMASGRYPEGLSLLAQGISDQGKSSREAALKAFCATVLAHREQLYERACALVREGMAESALARIQGALSSSDQSVRGAAVRILACSGKPQALDAILALGNDEGVFSALRESLEMLPPEAVSILLDRFDGLSPVAQVVAALAFGKTRCVAALPVLHRCLRSDFGHLLRAAAEAVGELSDERSTEDLVSLLEHPYPDVREAAVGALTRIAKSSVSAVLSRIGPVLDSPLAAARAAAVSVAGRVGTESGAVSRAILALGDPETEVRLAAAQALADSKVPSAATPLCRAIADEDPAVRRAVARGLGAFSGPEAVEALAIALKDPDLWVRCEAAASLGDIGGERALSLLEGVLSDKQAHPALLTRILEVLGQVALEKARQESLGLLSHPEPDVVLAALTVLGKEGKPDAQSARRIGALLSHEHWNVRAHAAALLGRVGTSEARGLIEARLSDERDPLVARSLAEALAQAGGE
ncbi:MAG: HEAT repeat domain-containing protein [Bdellovibrionota bacterium]